MATINTSINAARKNQLALFWRGICDHSTHATTALWQNFLNVACGPTGPTITPVSDGHYNIYDPSTQQRVSGLSESEVRIWLEQRYNQ